MKADRIDIAGLDDENENLCQRIAELELSLEHWIKTNNKSLEMIVTLAGRLSAERQRIAELEKKIKQLKKDKEISDYYAGLVG